MDITDIAQLPAPLSGENQKYDEVTEIEYIQEPIIYKEFFLNYMLKNKPCILGPWATEKWKSRKQWVSKDGTLLLDYMVHKFGDACGPAANCQMEEYQSHPKENMTFKEYAEYLEKYKENGYPWDMKCLYLKDWHFTRLFPDYEAYVTPEFFHSDWLNEFWDSRPDATDDYRFVYIGPKGSWTPFHADVFRSFSWSANICGQKRWIIFPPGEEENLKDLYGNLVYDLDSTDLQDPKKFPNYNKVKKKFEVIQNSGEILFVPSGWHHQVYNTQDTISINHNWLNGCNILLSWQFLKSSLKEVEREISDVRDMDGWHKQCQIILKTSSGIDYSEFYSFLHTIAARRLTFLSSNEGGKSTCEKQGPESSVTPDQFGVMSCKTDDDYSDPRIFQGWKVSSQPYYLTRNHALFDLIQIEKILSDMTKNKEFLELDQGNFIQAPVEFLHEVQSAISDNIHLSQ